jgi:hypothetical protein
VVELIVAGFMTSLNVAFATAPAATPVVPSSGDIESTLGG